jgi:hypothetical protein
MSVEIKTDFLGHQIAFTWGADGCKLYLDGKIVDTYKEISKDVTLVRCPVTENGEIHIVEVIYTGLWNGAFFVLSVDGREHARKKLG